MIILHRCCICGEILNPEVMTMTDRNQTHKFEDTICDVCEMEAVAEAETFGVPTSDIEGDLALTRELI